MLIKVNFVDNFQNNVAQRKKKCQVILVSWKSALAQKTPPPTKKKQKNKNKSNSFQHCDSDE